MNWKTIGLAAGLALAAPAAAQAHMPYLAPNLFDAGDRDHVTVQASFSEDAFVPDIVLKSDAFHVRGPAGKAAIEDPVYLRDLAVFEAGLPAKGTYRISTGERAGRKGKMYKAADGQWIMGGESAPPPAGVALVDVQSMSVAEVYVTRGAPSPKALAPTGKGLELKPITHPSEIFAKAPASFELLFEGKPVPGATVELYRAAGLYDGRKMVAQVKTDAGGKMALTPPDAGTYLALVRHRIAAPTGAETPFRSYSYTLAFEATE